MSQVEINGELLEFDHRKALVWPRRRAVIIADTHFGKSAVFRREGIALPEGSDAEDLETIARLLEEHSAKHLYILGDFVHGALPRGHHFYPLFNQWRSEHREIDLQVVLGNHDMHLYREELEQVHWHTRLELEPFELVHEPRNAAAFYIAGHIHPVVRLSTRADSLRMPVFWLREDGLVLPSFGTMTGGHAIETRRSERRFGVVPGQVTELP